MREYLLCVLLFTLSCLGNAVSVTQSWSGATASGVEFAAVPTTSGQIGVNPVEDDLGPSSTYIGSVAPTDTPLITADAGTTHWLHKHIDYLTEETTSGTTKTVQVVVATATAAVDGQSVGDVSIVLAEGLAQALKDSASAAVKSCGITNLRKRGITTREDASSALSCLAKAAQDASGSDLYHGIEDSTWDALTIDLAPNVASDLAAAFQIFKTQARLKKQAIIYFAAASIALGGAELVGKINIPKTGFGVPTNSDNDCKGLKELGEESPLCEDKNCVGEIGGLCTIGNGKDCPCLGVMDDPEPYFWDGVNEMFSQAATLLPSIAAMGTRPATLSQASATTVSAPTPTPSCVDNKVSVSQDFTIEILADKNAIVVELPIANPVGDWLVKFDKIDSIAFWQIDSGATAFVPITNGNGAPPNQQINWTVPDGNPTTNTKMSLQFTDGNQELKATSTGSSPCAPSTTTQSASLATPTAAIYIMANIQGALETPPNEIFVFFDGLPPSDPNVLNINPCTATPAFSSEDTAPYDNYQVPVFPDTTISQFTSHGITGCQYIAATNGDPKYSPGVFTCAGGSSTVISTCQQSPGFENDQNCIPPGSSTNLYVPLLICSWPSGLL